MKLPDFTGAADQVERYRCDCKALFRRDQLVNLADQENPQGQNGWYQASGPCPKCGRCWHVVYGEFGPADLFNHYRKVGVKTLKVDTVKCAARCIGATSLECKCSCGGERHGVAA